MTGSASPPPTPIRNPASRRGRAPELAGLRRTHQLYRPRRRSRPTSPTSRPALAACGIEEGFMTSIAPGSACAHRQRLLQDRGRVPVRLRRRHARGIPGDHRCRTDPAARRSLDRRELGPDQPRTDRRGISKVHHAAGRGAEPRDQGPAARIASASISAGEAGTARTPPTSRCATSSR